MALQDGEATVEIFQLNHASVLVVMGGMRLLFDPWYEGTAFDQGWALRWDNAQAYAVAASATHLWVSHPHSDHLHHPTLKRLQGMCPDITVICNEGYSYSLERQMRGLGFKHIVRFREGEVLAVGECTLERIGSGIIDSLLVVRWRGLTLLNLNDCVLQAPALKQMKRRVGDIDVLLCNFNHAGKLLHYPQKADAEVRATLLAHFGMQVGILGPRCVVPFASLHRYLAPFSVGQNGSLLEPGQLDGVALYPGQKVVLDFSKEDVGAAVSGGMPGVNEEMAVEDAAVSEEAFAEAVAAFERRIAAAFGVLRVFLPGVAVRISDNGKVFCLRRGRVTEVVGGVADIEGAAAKVAHWFGGPYGTDAFVVGGHFRILRPCVGRLKWLFALLLLAEAKVSPRYVFRVSLWRFLLRRRHELFAALSSGRVTSSYQ